MSIFLLIVGIYLSIVIGGIIIGSVLGLSFGILMHIYWLPATLELSFKWLFRQLNIKIRKFNLKISRFKSYWRSL